MIHRLSEILRKTKNKKFRNSYMKYLKSLDYDEFKEIYISYMLVIIKYEKIYKFKNPKKYSIKWLKNKIIEKKYFNFFRIFLKSNRTFCDKISKKIELDNVKRKQLLNSLNDVTNTINNLSKNSLKINNNPTQQEIIDFNVLIIDSIHLENQLLKITDEIKKYREF